MGREIADGSELRRIRKEMGLSLMAMARKVGVSAAYLSDVERGLVGASSGTRDRIGEHYGVTFITPKKRARLCLEACEGVPSDRLESGMLATLLKEEP
jgi:transcriptional regulator with XRE-family HTH domain